MNCPRQVQSPRLGRWWTRIRRGITEPVRRAVFRPFLRMAARATIFGSTGTLNPSRFLQPARVMGAITRTHFIAGRNEQVLPGKWQREFFSPFIQGTENNRLAGPLADEKMIYKKKPTRLNPSRLP